MTEHNKLVLNDGRTIGYAEYGDKNGHPLFFFHGWPSSRLLAPPVQQAAIEAHVRLISLDRPGYGISSYKENRTLADWGNDVIQTADLLKIPKFSVVGISGGGPYAAVCAYKISKRIHKAGIVVGLAPPYIPGILDDMPITGKLSWGNYANYPILAYLGAINLRYFSFSERYIGAKIDKEIFGSLWEHYKRNKDEAFRQGIRGAVQDLFLYTNDWGFDLNQIKSEVFLWYGEVDQNVPLAMGKYYKAQIPNSTLITYPNEGHTISITHAKEIFKTLTS